MKYPPRQSNYYRIVVYQFKPDVRRLNIKPALVRRFVVAVVLRRGIGCTRTPTFIHAAHAACTSLIIIDFFEFQYFLNDNNR